MHYTVLPLLIIIFAKETLKTSQENGKRGVNGIKCDILCSEGQCLDQFSNSHLPTDIVAENTQVEVRSLIKPINREANILLVNIELTSVTMCYK